jgi:putative ABC transport system permease protein
VNEIFGISMTSIMIVLVSLLALCLLTVAWVAWRRPVIFKLGVRNIPRRKTQTVLIVVGLMLSTLIISAALGTGDTVDNSVTSAIYDGLGRVDEVVVFSKDPDANIDNSISNKIPASAYDVVANGVKDDPNVDGVGKVLFEQVPAINPTSGQGEPESVLTGFDPATIETFGGLKATNGDAIDFGALAPDEIVISDKAADKLDASVGDELTIYWDNNPVKFKVAAIAEDSVLSGVIDFDSPGMVIPLSRMQQITGQTDQLSAVIVSNKGGVRGSEDLSEQVTATLNSAIAGQTLGVSQLKKDSVDEAETAGQIFTSLFLVIGLFSIAAGILLIVLIFTMLAAERRSEMGMARAIGAQRSQLVQQFVSEGSGYAILAGLVGSLFGVAASVGIALALSSLFGEFFTIQPTVSPRSMVVAYCLGVVITFVAVVGSSWKISRLNVVAAIRDLPDVSTGRRKKMTLFWGILLLLVGGLLTLVGVSSGSAFPFYMGMSLIPFGLLVALRFFGIKGRAVASAVGVYILLLWLVPDNIKEKLIGHYDGDFEMFFLSGIFLVLGATIVIVQNTDVLLGLVTRLGGLFKSKLPAVRTAVAYPGAARGRTGLTIAMFSLIIFSLVMMATMNANFSALFLSDEANAGWDVVASAGPANPIDDFTGTLQAKGVDTNDFKEVGTTYAPNDGNVRLRQNDGNEWEDDSLQGMDDNFIKNSELMFTQRADGYDSDDAIIQALLTKPNVAIIDASATESGGFGDDGFKISGVESTDKTFAPVPVQVQLPNSDAPATFTIIGVLDSKISSLFGMYANEQSVSKVFTDAPYTNYYVALTDPGNSKDVAESIEAAMLQNGVQATSIRDELKDDQREGTSFLYIIEGFMGLGLIVGIAAVGVIAFRSVVERRQQIGVLRALGYQRSMVSLSFMIETAFVVGMGILSGTTLGVILARNLFASDDVTTSHIAFTVPWATITIILSLTVVAALLMTWVPARQASRIAPAEALRYE